MHILFKGVLMAVPVASPGNEYFLSIEPDIHTGLAHHVRKPASPAVLRVQHVLTPPDFSQRFHH